MTTMKMRILTFLCTLATKMILKFSKQSEHFFDTFYDAL